MATLAFRASLLILSVLCMTPPRGAAAEPPLCAIADGLYPPWQHGANNDAIDRGLEFTVPEADNLADFHGDPHEPLLALYVGGNYFFAMAPLVQSFEAHFPAYRGHIYWETLPPGLLVQ